MEHRCDIVVEWAPHRTMITRKLSAILNSTSSWWYYLPTDTGGGGSALPARSCVLQRSRTRRQRDVESLYGREKNELGAPSSNNRSIQERPLLVLHYYYCMSRVASGGVGPHH